MTCEPLPCQQRWKLTIDSRDWQFLAGPGTWQSDTGVHLQIILATPSSPCSLPSRKDGISNQIQLCRATPSWDLQVTFSCHPCPCSAPAITLKASHLPFLLADLSPDFRLVWTPRSLEAQQNLLLGSRKNSSGTCTRIFLLDHQPVPNSHGGNLVMNAWPYLILQ